MENYQVATVVVGIISTAIWMIVGIAFPIAFIAAFVAFGFMFTCFADTKHCHTIGGIYIVVGILFNWLYLIPGIMAIRYKPKYEVKYRGNLDDEYIKSLEHKVEQLEKEKTGRR